MTKYDGMLLWRIKGSVFPLYLLSLLFLPTVALVTPILRGDGVAYYAYVASGLGDGDLQFADEYAHADPWHYELYFDEHDQAREQLYTRTGRLGNKFAVGPAVLWSPFFLMAAALDKLQAFGGNEDADTGFSAGYVYLCALGTALLGFFSLVFALKTVRRLVPDWAAFWGTVGMWGASALVVYMYFLPFMAHAHAAFVAALFVWYWHRTYRAPAEADARDGREILRTPVQWAVVGVIGGFLFTTYYVSAILLVFVVGDALYVVREGGVLRDWRKLRSVMARGAAPFVAGLILGLGPHLLIKTLIYGSPFVLGYGERWYVQSPRLLEVLFSSEHGLWVWTPVILLACTGLIPLVRRDSALGWRSVTAVIVFWYAIASFENWHGQSSFSNRFFVTLTPVFVIGLACLLDALGNSVARTIRAGRATIGGVRAASVLLICVLVVWNVGFVFQWGTNLVPNRGPISWGTMIHNQFFLVPGQMAETAGEFFRDRGALLERIQRQDMEEAREYRIRR